MGQQQTFLALLGLCFWRSKISQNQTIHQTLAPGLQSDNLSRLIHGQYRRLSSATSLHFPALYTHYRSEGSQPCTAQSQIPPHFHIFLHTLEMKSTLERTKTLFSCHFHLHVKQECFLNFYLHKIPRSKHSLQFSWPRIRFHNKTSLLVIGVHWRSVASHYIFASHGSQCSMRFPVKNRFFCRNFTQSCLKRLKYKLAKQMKLFLDKG